MTTFFPLLSGHVEVRLGDDRPRRLAFAAGNAGESAPPRRPRAHPVPAAVRRDRLPLVAVGF